MFTCEYEFKSKPIGEGAYGQVSIVERRGMRYVLKKLVSKKNEESMIQNPVELDILFRLNSPHLVKGYDITVAGECDKKDMGIDTEYVEGDIFDDRKKFTFEQKKKIMYDIACGLKCLHDNNYLHLDIKLENALYHKESKPRGVLIDYGMCAFCPRGVETGIELTNDKGTQDFSSPKMLSKNKKDLVNFNNKDDIWALALTYCMLLSSENDVFFDLDEISGKNTKEDAKKLYDYFKYYMSENHIDTYIRKNILKKKKDDMLAELLKEMLCLDETKRLSINQVINHPFFKEYENKNYCYPTAIEMTSLEDVKDKYFERIYEIIYYAKEFIPNRDPLIVFMAIDIYLRFIDKVTPEVLAKIENPQIISLLIAAKYFSWGFVQEEFDEAILGATKEENIIYKVINGNVKCERYYSNCKYIEDIKFIHMVFIDKKYESFNPNLRHYLNKDGKSFIEKYRPVGILHPIGNLTIADVF
jgi:serine/threonine protein kinase